jgi:hypothetical protein
MPAKKILVQPRATLKVTMLDSPATDIKGGDVFIQGWLIEVLPPGEEVFEVIPSAYLDASLQDDGMLPGQVSANGVIQRPKKTVTFKIEDFVEARDLKIDGGWTFTIRHVSLAGKVSEQEPYVTMYLDLSEPARTNVSPTVTAFPATGAITFGVAK